jgi:hypothetical protein
MLDLYTDELADRRARLRSTQDVEPGVFANFLPGTGAVAMRLAAEAARAGSMALSVVPRAIDELTAFTMGTAPPFKRLEATERYFKFHDEVFGSAVDYWTPKPNEVGVAAEVAGSLFAMLPMVMASPALAVASQQLSIAEGLVRRHPDVTAGQAQAVGAAQAIGLGFGIWAPILGNSLATRVLVGGAGANLVQGVATRAVSGAVLQGTEAAKEFEAFDPQYVTLDVLLGLAFGAYAHISPAQRAQGAAAWAQLEQFMGRAKPSEVDALAVLRTAQHLNEDSLPGKPATDDAVRTHVAKLRSTIDSLARDHPVDVERTDVPRETSVRDQQNQADGLRTGLDLRVDPRFSPDPAKEAAAREVADAMTAEAPRIQAEEGLTQLRTPAPRPPSDITTLEPEAQARAIGQQIERKLVDTGMQTNEAVANGVIWEAYARSAHALHGITPAELMARWGVDVRKMSYADMAPGALEQRLVPTQEEVTRALQALEEGPRVFDEARVTALRREAAKIETPKKGVYLQVNPNGSALATGPKGGAIPNRILEFAQREGLKLYVASAGSVEALNARNLDTSLSGGRLGADGRMVGPMTEDLSFRSAAPMPVEFREGGARYAAEYGTPWRLLDAAGQRYFQSETQPFYSELSRQVGTLKLNAAPAKGWQDALKGLVNKGVVKQAEIDATGLREWIELQQGRVTKQQVQDFLAQNGVRVEEVMLGTPPKGIGFALEKVDAKQPSFDITPALREKVMAGMPLFQPGARGAVNFEAGRTIINLFEKADKSTFQHETAHVFLEMTKDLATRPEAPLAAAQDWATIAKWLKIEGGQITRAQHEQWARGWEKYLAEGVAPNEGLKGAFKQFRDWLLDIYKSLAGIDSPINNQIRGAMARLLDSQAKDPIARGGLDDPRLRTPEYSEALEMMGRESGWAEVGGRIIRDPLTGEVSDRTRWIAHAEWYHRMQQNENARLPGGRRGVERAVQKAVMGESMSVQERRAVTWMLDEHAMVLKQWEESGARTANPDGDPFEAANIRAAQGIDETPNNVLDMALIDRAKDLDAESVENIPNTYDDVQFMAAIKEIIDAKRTTAETDQGRGSDARGPQELAAPRQVAGGGRPPPAGAGREAGGTAGTDALRNEALRVAEEHSELRVRTGTAPDGTPMYASILELLDEAALQRQLAEQDANLFRIAAECYLG